MIDICGKCIHCEIIELKGKYTFFCPVIEREIHYTGLTCSKFKNKENKYD